MDHPHLQPWIGCQKVSPGCDNCYAETLSNRRGWTQWGPEGERVRTAPSTWKNPPRWDRAAARLGERHRVFCASLADVFDNQAPEGAREDLWELIRQTPSLDWQLLTKRPQNLKRCSCPKTGAPAATPTSGSASAPRTRRSTTGDGRSWRQPPAALRFISYEPALGPVVLGGHEDHPDWVIWGGESGPGPRPMQPDWARRITRECQDLGIAVFGKQWGSYASNPMTAEQGIPARTVRLHDPETNGKGGALLDGQTWRQFPR